MLSFPVRLLSRVMRRGLAIALSFLSLLAILALLEELARRSLLPQSPDRFVDPRQQNLLAGVQGFARRILGSLGGVVAGTLNTVVALFGMVFIAAYLLADARRLQAAVLRATAPRYRHDARALSDAFGHTLSRYLGGLAISPAVQGALSAIAPVLLGVPYALLLGAWVAVTALVPFLGPGSGPCRRCCSPSP